MGEQAPRGGRRAPAPPPTLIGELVRTRLLAAVGRRFDAPLTVIVAGAGFGKSTLLAQALRANRTDPRGVDAWLSCEPGDGDVDRVADAIVAALERASDRRQPVERALDAIGQWAPVDVCLVVDDVHEVPPHTPAAELLGELVDRLPPHAHILFAGRTAPPVPLARRRAAGQVVDVGDTELAFTPTEVAALGRLLDRDADALPRMESLGGWPSLVRLALSAPPGAARQFLWEEVVAGLPPSWRHALLALATLGWGSAADVARVAGDSLGDDATQILDAMSATVPFVRRDDDGFYGVHQLWEEAVERIFPAGEREPARRRALELFQHRDETLRTGWSALRWRDGEALRSSARHLVRDTLGALPIDTASRWLAAAPEGAAGSLDLQLLELALRHARRYDEPGLDDELIALVDRLIAAGDDAGAVVGLGLAALITHTRGDMLRLLSIDDRARSLPGVQDEPILRFLASALVAATASLEGDTDAAVRAVDELDYDAVPAPITEFVVRLHVNVLALAGHADEAVPVAARIRDSPSPFVRALPAHVRWWAGDATAFPQGRVDVAVAPGTNERYHLYHAFYTTAVAASFGDGWTIEALRPVIDQFAAGTLDSRDKAMIAVATALRYVVEHDDEAAARVIAAHADEHPATDRLSDIHLRRLLAVAYVSDERIRARWRDDDLGPSLRRQRDIADLLLAARGGTLAATAELPAVGSVLTTLPLPWSVELTARAATAGCAAAHPLVRGLAEHAAPAVRSELERAAESADVALRDGARALLDELPDPAQPPIRIGVLGPLTIDAGDAAQSTVDLRRGRVRTVLGLLIASGPMRRERIADLLWPELDADAAGRNLRVTLSRLRAALTSGSPGGLAPLTVDRETVALTPGSVIVDLWQFADDVAAADEAERGGDAAATIAALSRACARWRGDPLAGIDLVAGLDVTVDEIRRQLADAALRLGELLLVAGRFDDAATWAERVRAAMPLSERAHRLTIAAHLQRHDHRAVVAAVETATSMFAALGVEPELPTQMLLRQAAARTGPVTVG